MKFLNSKKVLCTVASLALLVSSLPATIVSAALDREALNVLYENYFDGTTTNVQEQEAGITSLSADPTDPENADKKVLKITASGETIVPDGNIFDVALINSNSTFASKGYESGKPVIYEMKLYVTDDFVHGEGNDLSYNGVRIGPAINDYSSVNKTMYNISLIKTQNSKTATSGNVYLSENKYGDTKNKSITTNAWHTFKWVADGSTVSMWVDGTAIYTGKSASFTSTTKMQGIKIFAHATSSYPLTLTKGSALYVDDIKIYQVKEDFSGQFSYNVADSIGTLTLNHAITEADLANITVADSTGTAVTPSKSLSADGKVVTLSFGDSLKSEATYTVSAASLMDEFGQTLSVSTFTFTAPKKLISYLFQNDYSSEKKVKEYESGITSLSEDPENSANQVLKITASGTAITEDNVLDVFNVALTDVPSNTFAQNNYTSGKPVIYEMKLYVPNDTVHMSGNSFGYNGLRIGPAVNSDPKSYNLMFRMGLNQFNVGKAVADGKVAVANGKWESPNTTITTNAWHTFKWITTGSTISMWIDGSSVVVDQAATFTSSSKMNGIKISTSTGATLQEGSTLYVDDVKVYQVADTFELTRATYDAATGTVLVSTGSQPTDTTINNIKLMNGDADVSGSITARAWDPTNNVLKLTVPVDSLQVATDYTVVLPKNSADLYGQITSAVQEATFTTPKSWSVSLKNASVTSAPSSTGAAASIVLENGAASRDVWVVMAVYGQYNELLGVDAQTITVDGTTQPLTFTTADDCSGALNVKVFIWDGPNTMIPLQNSESIWTPSN